MSSYAHCSIERCGERERGGERRHTHLRSLRTHLKILRTHLKSSDHSPSPPSTERPAHSTKWSIERERERRGKGGRKRERERDREREKVVGEEKVEE